MVNYEVEFVKVKYNPDFLFAAHLEKKILGGGSGCVSTLQGGREENRGGTEAGCGTRINPEIHEGQAPSSLIRKHSSAAKGNQERASPVVQ